MKLQQQNRRDGTGADSEPIWRIFSWQIKMILDQAMKDEDTAYHEAGHAVVGAVLSRAHISVTIVPDGSAAGKNEFPDDGHEFKRYWDQTTNKRCYIETRILTRVAGTAAHDLHDPDRPHDEGDAHDERCARKLLEESASWAESDRDGYLQQLQDLARDLLQEHWLWVQAVARALIERKTISTVEVMDLRPRDL